MKSRLCRMLTSPYRVYLWHLIVVQFLVIAIMFVLLSLSTSEMQKHQLQAEMSTGDISYAEKSVQWMELPNKLGNLNMNPVYAKFNVSHQKKPSRVNLLVIVSSAPKRYGRRLAIRETWWQQCKSTKRVTIKCIFMTDYPNESTDIGQRILKEKIDHKDVEFQHLEGGVEFGKRYLYHLLWTVQNFDFDYFLRIDDDYFICLDRLINELPMPPQRMYHWGYVHCIKHIVRPEESIVMFSRDLVETFLVQDPLLIKSHPWADQMIATWVSELQLPKIYNHDPRLHHSPTLLHIKNVSEVFKNVCNKYIGVHGSYPIHMKTLWRLRGENQELLDATLNEYTKECDVPQIFVWEEFKGVWKYPPRRFITNPVWNTSMQNNGQNDYGGREEGLGEFREYLKLAH